MRSSGASDGGNHSKSELTRRTFVGSPASGFFAPTHRLQKPTYWIPEGPGHWAEGSGDCANGLPMTPRFVVLIQTLPAVETHAPGPTMSGGACGASGDRSTAAPAGGANGARKVSPASE